MSFKISTTSDFEREAKRLAKKYASFKADFAKFCEAIQKNPLQGDELYPGIRKIRMAIKSKGKGKSGGTRVITYNILLSDDDGEVIFLLMYDKEEYATVDLQIIKKIVQEIGII